MNDTIARPDITQRPNGACALCPPPRQAGHWRRADDGYCTCSSCLDRLRDTLRDIAGRYGKLNPRPGATNDHTSRGAPGFGSRSPANDHIIAMRDPRSSPDAHVWVAADGKVHRESVHPPQSVYGVLDTIAWDIAENRDITGPTVTSIDGLTRWIDTQLDWATRQPSIAELGEQLRGLQSQLRPVTGDRRRKIGACPNSIDEGERTRECGGPLFAPGDNAADDTIRCRACGRPWPRAEWLRLGDLLQPS